MRVENEGGWFHRLSKNFTDVEAIDRISVNANTDKELIQKLDELFGSGQIKGYFKTPNDAVSWLERHEVYNYLFARTGKKDKPIS